MRISMDYHPENPVCRSRNKRPKTDKNKAKMHDSFGKTNHDFIKYASEAQDYFEYKREKTSCFFILHVYNNMCTRGYSSAGQSATLTS